STLPFGYCLLLRFSLYFYLDQWVFPSFPTRRSSDLDGRLLCTRRAFLPREQSPRAGYVASGSFAHEASCSLYRPTSLACCLVSRSEEHTSELQSRENLVCRLLLEKKKKHIFYIII